MVASVFPVAVMISDLLMSFDVVFILVSITIYFLAGIIKGTLGIGFPTAAVSLLAQFSDARTAIIVVIMPMLLTNVWQVIRSGRFLSVVTEYWRLILMMSIFSVVFSAFASTIRVDLLAVALGVIVVVFALYSLYGRVVSLPDKWDNNAQFAIGGSAGVMAGLVSVWAPPILIYMSTKRLPKEQFVATIGAFLLIGSSALLATYVHTGVLSQPLFILSCVLVIPAIAGFVVGEFIRHKLSAQRFERLLLWFFLMMGLNLIRKSLW